MIIDQDLVNFIFESDDLRLENLDPQITETQYEVIIGKERFKRLYNLAYRAGEEAPEKIEISDIEFEDLLYIYYEGDINNKSIENIENDFKIKKLLE